MSRCTKCGSETPVLYMCDLDEQEGEYCVGCFEEMGCEEEHGEGCMTQVFESYEDDDLEGGAIAEAWDSDGEDDEDEED